MEDGAGAARDADISGLENLERHHRGVEQVAQFVRQEPDALASARALRGLGRQVLFAAKLGDGAGNGLVEASIQQPEVAGADRRLGFDGQLDNGLADVAVVVYDLREGKPLTQQVMPVFDAAGPNLRARIQAQP